MKEIRNTLQEKCRRGLNDRFKNLFEEAGGKKTIRKPRIRKPKDNVSSSTSVPNGTTSNTTISNLISVAKGIVSSSTSVPNTVSSSISAGGTVAVSTTVEPMKLPNPITHIESPTTSVPNTVSSSISASGTVAVGTTVEPMKLPNPITHIESPTEPITNIIMSLILIAELRATIDVKTTVLNRLFPQVKTAQQEYHNLLRKLFDTYIPDVKTMINNNIGGLNQIFDSNGIFGGKNIDDILIAPSYKVTFGQIRVIKHNNQINCNIVNMYVCLISSQIYNSNSNPPFCGLSKKPSVKYSDIFIRKLLNNTKFEDLVEILDIPYDKNNPYTIYYDTMILPYMIDNHWFICEVCISKTSEEELYTFVITSTLDYATSTLPPNAPMKTVLGTKIRNFFFKLSDKVRFLKNQCPQMDIINLFSKLEAYTMLKLKLPTLSDVLSSIILNRWVYKNRLIENDV